MKDMLPWEDGEIPCPEYTAAKQYDAIIGVDCCVCCGAYVPEGVWVCPNCEKGALTYRAPYSRKASQKDRRLQSALYG